MRQRVLILHGWGGSDYPHWQSFVAREIAKDYGCVSFLKFSNVDTPDKDIWLDELKKELREFKPTTVLCHSIANILWFHLCNEGTDIELEKLFLVAPPSLECDIKELSSFYPCDIPTKLYAKQSLLITSTNDPYITQSEASNLQNTLAIDMKIIENGGHINVDSGFGEWRWMVEAIKENPC